MKWTTMLSGMALIIAVIAIIVAGYQAGVPGPEGPIGPQGIQGIQGDIGPQGLPGINGTDGANGTDGERGPIGPRGFTGPRGYKGEPGEDGLDYVPNLASTVTINELNGTYLYRPCVWHDFTFIINVTVDDPEDDAFHITFYYRHNENDAWNKHVEYIGTDGYYTDSIMFTYFKDSSPRTLYWLVEVWDGSDLGLNYFNHTITPT